jgi:hypothetical protein
MNNNFIFDTNLSLEAKGLLAYLSHKNFEFNNDKEVLEGLQETREDILRIIKEIEDAGYKND